MATEFAHCQPDTHSSGPRRLVRDFAAILLTLTLVAPAAHADDKRGLFVELDGFRGAGMGTNSTFVQEDRSQSASTSDKSAYTQEFGYRTPRAWGGAAYVGYWFRDDVAVVGGFAIFTYDTVPIHTYTDDGSGKDGVSTLTESIHSDLVTLGLRMSKSLGVGRLRIGAGFAFMLPYAMVSEEIVAGEGTYTTRRNVGSSLIGGYGELGYDVSLWRGLYLGLALKVHVAQSRRDGQTIDVHFVSDSGEEQKGTTKHQKSIRAKDVTTTNVGSRQVPSVTRPYSQIFADARACLTLGWAF
ncbi:MAG: hypothetical protein KC502_15795 [Myxococcales bacterium]|nr:hypothetical protein [Myxococcales bacterium]